MKGSDKMIFEKKQRGKEKIILSGYENRVNQAQSGRNAHDYVSENLELQRRIATLETANQRLIAQLQDRSIGISIDEALQFASLANQNDRNASKEGITRNLEMMRSRLGRGTSATSDILPSDSEIVSSEETDSDEDEDATTGKKPA